MYSNNEERNIVRSWLIAFFAIWAGEVYWFGWLWGGLLGWIPALILAFIFASYYEIAWAITIIAAIFYLVKLVMS